MGSLKALLVDGDDIALKRAFMPISAPIEVDGNEIETAVVLLNLSYTKDKKKLANKGLAKKRLKEVDARVAIEAMRWLHTHNLKSENAKVKQQRIVASAVPCDDPFISSQSLPLSFGWSNNSQHISMVNWLLCEFVWSGETVTLFQLVYREEPVWISALRQLGLKVADIKLIKTVYPEATQMQSFPEEKSTFSKALVFPWNNIELTVTPVVSHAMQASLQQYLRSPDCQLKHRDIKIIGKPQNFSHLANALGGHLWALNYPLTNTANMQQTLYASRIKTPRYFDESVFRSERNFQLLQHLTGSNALASRTQALQQRRDQLRLLRQCLGEWLLPLFEFRDYLFANPDENIPQDLEEVVLRFFSVSDDELWSLIKPLNLRLQQTLQNGRHTRRFAFHPRLMRTTARQLKSLFTRLLGNEQVKSTPTDTHFLYLSQLRAFDVNGLSSPLSCGMPSMTGLWGFMRAFEQRFIDLAGCEACEFSRFAFFVHSATLKSSPKLPAANKAVKTAFGYDAQPTAVEHHHLSDMVFDMVIEVRASTSVAERVKDLKQALPQKFVGGHICPPPATQGIRWLSILSSRSELAAKVAGLPRYGSWIVPSDCQVTSWQALDNLLKSRSDLLPTNIGFHFLEMPRARKGARTHTHVYAENAIGVVKKINPIDIRLGGVSHFIKEAFWTMLPRPSAILIGQQEKD